MRLSKLKDEAVRFGFLIEYSYVKNVFNVKRGLVKEFNTFNTFFT